MAAIEVLEKENVLLDQLAKKVAQFTQNLAPNERDVLKDWELFFDKWRGINTNLINSSNADDLLAEEKQVLIAMRDSIAGKSASANFWREMLSEDIDNVDKLL